jgi:uncharacterized membrane protein
LVGASVVLTLFGVTLFVATAESGMSAVGESADDVPEGAATGGVLGVILAAVVTGFVATLVKGVAAPLELTHCIQTA